MTFQQEERRREELLRQQELKQEELRRMKMQAEQMERQEEETRAREEKVRQEEVRRKQEEERRKKEEEKVLEKKKRMEEQKRREEEEKKRLEIERYEKLKREEEAIRQEEMRLEQEMRKQYELQQQQLLAEQRVQEQQMREQQMREQQMREQQMREQQMREQQMREQQMKEQKMREQQMKEQQMREEKIREQQVRDQQMKEQQIREQQMREQQMREQQIMAEQMREQQMREQQMKEQQTREQQMKEQQMREQQISEHKMREQESLMKIEADKESSNVRGHIPKIIKTSSFDHSQDRSSSAQRQDDHLGKVRTGQVHDKRNFWIRSTSADRVNGQTLSPAPRRRRMEGWNPRQKENDDPESRPGSSLGQAQTGSVKNISSGFISKSKSSAAVMQDGERGRPRNKAIPANSWTKEKYDQQTNQNFLKSQEVKTNKVNDTLSTWGKHEQSTSGRTTPVPSRNIGQVFSENRVAKVENERNANSWRTKTPEPSVKLMNVSVEKASGSNQSIRFSENAHAQMASFVQEGKTVQQSVMMKQELTSTVTNGSSTTCSVGSAQPPPTPERNQSFGGKCADSKPKVDNTKIEPKPCIESQLLQTETDVQPKPNQEYGVHPNKNSVSQQDKNQNTTTSLQNSTSAQSINSILSNCSSGALPLPVKNLWFDELENMSAASSSLPEGVLSPTGTGITPVPVVAQWFTHSDFEKKSTTKNQSITQDYQAKTKVECKPLADDFDTRSVKSDATVIENIVVELDEAESDLPPPPPIKADLTEWQSPVPSQANEPCPPSSEQSDKSGVITVPQSPSEIRKKFQQQASFEKSFQKSAELELSKEFRAGVKGKVRESKESFLKKSNSGKIFEGKEWRDIELEAVKLHRSDSRNFEDTIIDQSDALKQEKKRELEDVKRSRSQKQKEYNDVQATFNNERLERQTELASLSHRKLDIEDAYLFSPTELKEITLREERERELAELAKRRDISEAEDNFASQKERQVKAERIRELAEVAQRKYIQESESISTAAQKEQQIKSDRNTELAEISQRQTTDNSDSFSVAIQKEKRLKAERNLELMALADRKLDIDLVTISRAEQLRQERSEELKEIAKLRSNSFSQEPLEDREAVTGTPELESDEVRGRVRGTAAIWQERERSAGREGGRSTCTTPTRRIGSMFKRDPEYWGREEELPAPPSDVEADSANPPPPPRQSSRGKVEEYRHWTGHWSSAPAHHKLH